jgi:predicted O-methyltransferase YrrM
MKSPSCILEIGTYTGYGTLCLAEGLLNGGKIFTIDRNEELLKIQNKYF